MTLTIIFVASLWLVPSLHAQWEQTNGPYGGPVTSLRLEGNRAYALSSNGTLFYSSDSGSSWRSRRDELSAGRIVCFDFSEDFVAAGSSSDGLFCSSNAGQDWLRADAITEAYIKNVCVDHSVIYALAPPSLYRSTDRGGSWTRILSGIVWPKVPSTMVMNGSVLILAIDGSINYTLDSGATWLVRSTPFQGVLAIAAKDSVMLCSSDARNGGVAFSNDSGQTWRTDLHSIPRGWYSGYRGLYISDSDLYVAGDSGVYVSKDGLEWTKRNTGLNWDVSSVSTIASSGNRTIIGIGWDIQKRDQNSGVFSWDDSAMSWRDSNRGLTASIVNQMASSKGNVYAATEHGVFVKSIDSEDWKTAQTGLASLSVQSIATCDSDVIAGTWESAYVASDENLEWVPHNFRLSNRYIRALGVRGHSIYAGSPDGQVYVTTPHGPYWEQVAKFTPGIMSFFTSGNHLLVGTDHVGIRMNKGDNETWIDFGGSSQFSFVNDIDESDHYYLAATDSGLFRRHHDSTRWSKCEVGLLDTNVVAVETTAECVFVCTGAKTLLMSKDEGESWTDITGRLPNVRFRCLNITNEYLFVGTHGSGVWRLRLDSTTSTGRVDAVQPIVHLQVSPSPASGTSEIEFELMCSSHVNVRVHNALYEELQTLTSHVFDAGKNAIPWSTQCLAPGLYFVRVVSESCVRSIPVVVIH